MARLPRLVLPGHAHLVVQPVLAGCTPFADEADRLLCLQALREAVAAEPVRLHGFGLRSDALLLVLTPAEAPALARAMQALGRRHVAAYNRRHARSGTLWAGRFRSAPLEPGETVVHALLLADGSGPAAGTDASISSAAHHLGLRREPWLHDPPEYWQLGNTPFDRERVWADRLAQGAAEPDVAALEATARGGWVAGSAAFVAAMARDSERPLRPRMRGRPRRSSAA